jgi:hypothetical protein
MFVVVLLAFDGAGIAGAGAKLEHFAKNLFVASGSPEAQARRCLANVGAIQAHANALTHVHFLSRAGIRAAQAHFRTVHGVMNGIAERLVDVTLNVRVQADHLANGHGNSPRFLWRTIAL